MSSAPVATDRPYDRSINLAASSRDQILLSCVGRNKRVLELGCWDGLMSSVIRSNGCTITGVEQDSQAAKLAAKWCEKVVVADLNQQEWQRGLNKFEVILMADVLEHLVDPGAALKTCRALLAPAGRIVVSLPNVAHWRIRLKLLQGKFDYTEKGILDRTHVKFFTVKTSRELIESTGYRVIDFYPSALRPTSRMLAKHVSPGLFAFQFIYVAALD